MKERGRERARKREIERERAIGNRKIVTLVTQEKRLKKDREGNGK